MHLKTFTYFVLSLVLAGLAGCVGARSNSAVISLDPSVTFQTMRGWETVVHATVAEDLPLQPAFDRVFQQAVDDLGITRLRISIHSGTEHPPGYAQHYLNGGMSEGTLVSKFAYDIINDNADPNVANTAAFDFTLLDWRMENMVLPIKKYVEARGQKVYSYLCYIDFGRSSFEHFDHPEEYAEFMLVLFDHLKSKYDFVPDGIDVINEPDHTHEGWTPSAIGNAIAKTGTRLAAAGYKPDFIMPSTMDRGLAAKYFDEAIAIPGAREFVKELSFHCYADTGTRSLEAIAQRAVQYNVSVLQNECWRDANTYRTLHEDLKAGRSSAWQQGGLSGKMHAYYTIDPSTLHVTLSPKTRLMRQYYKYVRPGARRVQADTTNDALDPIAFINSDNQYAVVVKAESAGDFTIQNLPAGTYGSFYTTSAEFDTQAPNVELVVGEPLKASIPAAGVITVYGKQD
jgi:hypothetical protein